jgi:hypothetical protein
MSDPLAHRPGQCRVCDAARGDHQARVPPRLPAWGPPEDSDRFEIMEPLVRWPLSALTLLALSGAAAVVGLVFMGRFVWRLVCQPS